MRFTEVQVLAQFLLHETNTGLMLFFAPWNQITIEWYWNKVEFYVHGHFC